MRIILITSGRVDRVALVRKLLTKQGVVPTEYRKGSEEALKFLRQARDNGSFDGRKDFGDPTLGVENNKGVPVWACVSPNTTRVFQAIEEVKGEPGDFQ